MLGPFAPQFGRSDSLSQTILCAIIVAVAGTVVVVFTVTVTVAVAEALAEVVAVELAEVNVAYAVSGNAYVPWSTTEKATSQEMVF